MKKRASQDKKIVLGVTGGVGTGKTTVAGYFRRFGAKVIDADKLVHKLIKPGSSVHGGIVAVFGKGILKKGRSIDRLKLSRLAFASPAALRKLNKIVHPRVIRVIRKEIGRIRRGMIVLDVPLLFEAGLQRMADAVIVVTAGRKSQLERVARKTALSKKEISMRIKAQMPLSTKIRRADFIIDNSGTREETKKQVKNLRRMLWKN